MIDKLIFLADNLSITVNDMESLTNISSFLTVDNFFLLIINNNKQDTWKI